MVQKLLIFMVALSVLICVINGDLSAASNAVLEGASGSVTLVISICGSICLWSGLAKIMEDSGFVRIVAAPFRPMIRLIFGKYANDSEFSDTVGQNIAANFLGLGNLATPMGLRAAERLMKIGGLDVAIRLMVLNTASIQLVPATLAAARLALGAEQPFDILPCVIISSVLSVAAGMTMCVLLEKAAR